MYNFGVPAPLKNWIDAISRAGVTLPLHGEGPRRPAQGQDGLRGADARRQVPEHAGGHAGPVSADGLHVPRHDRRAFRVRRGPCDGRGRGAEARSPRRTSRSRKPWRRNATRRMTRNFAAPVRILELIKENAMTTTLTKPGIESVTRPRSVERLIAGQPTSGRRGREAHARADAAAAATARSVPDARRVRHRQPAGLHRRVSRTIRIAASRPSRT